VTERLGYTVPPGRWGIQVALSLIPAGEPPFVGERTVLRTPVLPLEITA
jgi:hypothetical protein